MTTRLRLLLLGLLPVLTLGLLLVRDTRADPRGAVNEEQQVRKHEQRLFAEGQQTFRFDSFGSEAFFGDALRLHEAIAGEANGGVGPGVSPRTALAVGLKVDVKALPKKLQNDIKNGKIDLDDPATTLALLRLNAVVGVKGQFDSSGRLSSVGITCALCHSTVNDTLAPGIGHRLDGWANLDLNVGAIIGLSPDLSVVNGLLGTSDAQTREVLASWGPGRFDAVLFMDGKAFRPDGETAAVLIPPAYGLAGVILHTFAGWGSVTYWNAFVANLEMHGTGVFYDPRLDDPENYPVAAQAGFGDVRSPIDRITCKLAALHFYQLALPAPTPPKGSFDPVAAARGREIFNSKANCATCHVPPLFTEPGWNMHIADEIGIDDFQASRSPDGRYRTTPLAGLWAHARLLP